MSKSIQSGRQKPAKAIVGKARAGRSASVMKPEYLAAIVAHSVTNLVLGIQVVVTGNWAFW